MSLFSFILVLINLIIIFTNCFRYDDLPKDDSVKLHGVFKISIWFKNLCLLSFSFFQCVWEGGLTISLNIDAVENFQSSSGK